MIQTRVAYNIVKGTGGAGSGIAGAEHESCNPGMNDRARAHHTGFQGAIERRSCEPIVRQMMRGLTHRDDFRMACGIVCRNRPVVTAADNLAVFRHNKRTDGNFSSRLRVAGFGQRLFHEMFVHCRMLNYSAMKPLRSLGLAALVLLLYCLSGFAQGVRMPADFFPLDVGTRWTYDLIGETGQKVGQMSFAVQEYTIVAGTSFYSLTEFPFTEEQGEPVQLIRYDRTERQFMRKRGSDEGPLFLESGTTTEVLESDPSGTPQKFVLRTDSMTLTFQRGVGIVEARLKSPAGPLTAKMVSVQGRNIANTRPSTTPGPVSVPRSTEVAISPPPVPVPSRRESPTATVTSTNPRVDVVARPVPGGHEIVMVATNVDERLLPFRFGSSQTYDFIVTSVATGKEVWRWSRGQFFTQVVRSDSIRPRDKWQFEAVWNHLDSEGNKVPPGQYRLNAIITSLPQVHAVPQMLDVR
jgi:hypothetical protein